MDYIRINEAVTIANYHTTQPIGYTFAGKYYLSTTPTYDLPLSSLKSRAKHFANLYMNSLSITTISNIELEQTKNIINRDIMQLE